MSTEHQKYSTENQGDAIHRYAAERHMDVVRTYADEGKSGLRLDGRDALKLLFSDVQNGRADYDVIRCQWRRQIVPEGGVKVYQSG